MNATSLNDRPSGAKNRFVGIYGRLFKRMVRDRFYVFEPSDCRLQAWFPEAPNVEFVKTSLRSDRAIQRYFQGRFFWHPYLANLKPDVFETYHLPLVKSPVGRTILTIHDIRYVRRPTLYKPLYRLLSRGFLKRALNQSDLIITVSNELKNDLLTFSPSARVTVIYNGVDPHLYQSLSPIDLNRVRQRYDLPKRFLLSVGHLERRKNYPRLIEAVAQLTPIEEINLVIVGGPGDDSERITKRIATLDLGSRIKILSSVPDKDLRCLYRLAELFVMQSVYEGFGIPLIEAMAAKCPVVTSNLAVFREITGNGTPTFDAQNPQSIAQVIREVYFSPAAKSRLISHGMTRADQFTYDRMAEQLELLYYTEPLGSKID